MSLERLVAAVQSLSLARTLEAVASVVREAARELTGADGATFILRDGELCYYADENAISPLWKGKRFPIDSCVSGMAMKERRTLVLPDIYADDRVPHALYRPTFVKSMAMVPIRESDPIGAIGNYWAVPHVATDEELRMLQALADSTSVALENVRLYEEQERRVREREEFIAVAAHELRTPLAALQINLQMLQRERHGEVHDRNVTLAAASARRMSNLVETLLDASDRSGIELDRREVDLAELTREVAESFAPLAVHARCEVSVRAEQPVRGSWDPQRLQQAISNLLSNAFKYGAAKPVQIAVDQPDGMARLTVRDHGPGVTGEQTARMFEAFQRGGPLRNYGGFGVGLYLTRRIVEAHGGTIQVSAGPTGGATFQIELPRAG